MMGLRLSRSQWSPIAIDFGADSIKLLQVVLGDRLQLVAAATAALPEQGRIDMSSRAALIPDALRMLLNDHPFKGRRAVCSIPAFQTLVQNLQIDAGDESGGGSGADDQIALQLRQRLNVDAGRMVVRSLPVAQGGAAGSKHEVVCMAAGREVVMQYVDMARRAKLDVIGMHCEPVAIINAFAHLYHDRDAMGRTTVFIDIGAATTKCIIGHGASIVFAKTIHAAGDHFTRQYAKEHDASFDEARKNRFAAACQPADHPKPSSSDDDPFTGEAYDCLIDELMLCMRYYKSVFPDRTVEKLVFLGGEARHVGLCQKVASSLGVAAQLGDPLARLTHDASPAANAKVGSTTVELSQPQPGWAVPMGLCLKEAG